MALEALFTAAALGFIALFFIFLISSLPLYFAVKLLGGHTSILKTMLVAFVSGILVSAVKLQFRLIGGIMAFFLLIWIYHEVFRLKWLKAFLAWFLQFIFIALIYTVAAVFFAALIIL